MKVQITLDKGVHWHNSNIVNSGDVIDVPDKAAALLIEKERAKAVGATEKVTETKPTTDAKGKPIDAGLELGAFPKAGK